MTVVVPPAPIRIRITFLPGLILIAALAGIAGLGTLDAHTLPLFNVLFGIAALAYAWSVLRLRRRLPSTLVLWLVAIGLRLALLWQPPYLSSDVQRYIWDGHLLVSGMNPYFAPVESPMLDAYAIPVRDLVQHPWMASPYFPLAQFYFGLIGWLAPGSGFAFQLSALTFDLAAGWLLWRWLPRLGIPAAAAIIHLWHPLAALEFAHGAHVDAWMLLLMLAALWFSLEHGGTGSRDGLRQTLSVLFLAGAVLVKGLPLLLAPLLMPRWGWRRSLLFTLLLVAPLAYFAAGAGWGLSGPYDGVGVFGAFRIYANYWQFNPGFFALTSGLFKAAGLPAEIAGQAARLLSGAMLAAIVVWCALAARRLNTAKREPASILMMLRLCLLPLLASLLLAPTLHPWYVTVVLPLLAFLWGRRSNGWLLGAGLLLSLTVVLSYTLYFTAPASLASIVIAMVIYLPVFALLTAWAWQRVRTRALPTSINHTQLGGDT